MVIENEISSFLGWLLGPSGAFSQSALLQFVITLSAIALLAFGGGFLTLLVRYGPLKAGDLTYRTLSLGLVELGRISPRRVLALAQLASREALRRRAWVVLAVFALVLVFASWFVSKNNADVTRVYLEVTMTASVFLSLMLGLFLSAFSLPADFKNRTIFTLVTKPVRAGDIVPGRILGFGMVGTLALLVMGTTSYVFVTRSLSHTHPIELASLENVVDADGQVIGKRGETGVALFHRHAIEVDAKGNGVALSAFGHEHPVTASGDRLVVGPPSDLLRARVPQRGAIRFIDRQGAPAERGVSVGNEWTYRSFIDGGTSAAAIWSFDGVTESSLVRDAGVQSLPLELLVRVFRTHKGDVTKPIQGSIQLRNPETGLKSRLSVFPAKDAQIDNFSFAREQFDTQQRPIDLIRDLVTPDGRLEVVVQCLERGQYFGFARADCFLRRPDGSPLWNFVKGYLGMWVQMMVLIAIGVTASTFLSGPIAALVTVAFLILGLFRDFLIGIATGVQPDGVKVYGGGPVEALVRLVTQKNVVSDFDESAGVSLMKGADSVLQTLMKGVASVLPDFASLSSARYVSQGFAIPAPVLGRELAICLAYLVGLSIAGYFLLRTREVAK